MTRLHTQRQRKKTTFLKSICSHTRRSAVVRLVVNTQPSFNPSAKISNFSFGQWLVHRLLGGCSWKLDAKFYSSIRINAINFRLTNGFSIRIHRSANETLLFHRNRIHRKNRKKWKRKFTCSEHRCARCKRIETLMCHLSGGHVSLCCPFHSAPRRMPIWTQRRERTTIRKRHHHFSRTVKTPLLTKTTETAF